MAHELPASSADGDPRGRWLLDASHAESANEFAICGLLGGEFRELVLDRTFVEDGVRWIIDYKTGRHEGGDRSAFLDREMQRYKGQLDTYAELMNRLDPRPIRLGLYFPMLCEPWPAT